MSSLPNDYDESDFPPPPPDEYYDDQPPGDPIPDELRIDTADLPRTPSPAPVPAGFVHQMSPRIRALLAARRAASQLDESAEELDARVTAAPATALITELVSAEEIALWHGLPRAGKSLLLLRALIDCALGDSPVWDCPRFSLPAPLRVLYFTEEDGAGLVNHRISALLAGRAIPHPRSALTKETFRVVVRRGLTFDQDAPAATIRKIIDACKPDLVAFDPLRSFTSNCDQGPALLYPVARFLRTLLNETSAKALIVGHHDVKPSRDGVDNRGRAHRASGGGIFSIADSPINFERPDDKSPIYCFPSLFKGRITTPEAFSVSLSQTPPTSPGAVPGVRFAVTLTSEAAPLDEAILAFIAEHPGCSGRNLRTEVKGATPNVVSEHVTSLVYKGSISRVAGPHRAYLHYLPGSEPSVQATEPLTPQPPTPQTSM